MHKRILTAALAGTLLIAPVFVPQAHAGYGGFSVGVGFRIGGAHIALAYGQPVGYGYAYGPAYYYRYDRPVAYRGYHCSRYCYHQGGYYYHHESCPLVHAHFAAYGVDPYYAFSHYAPPGGYGYQPYADGYYDGGYDGGYYANAYPYPYPYSGGIYIDYHSHGYYNRHHDSHYYGHYDNHYYGGGHGGHYGGGHGGHYDRNRGGHGGNNGHGSHGGRGGHDGGHRGSRRH